MKDDALIRQSNTAYSQWAEQWRANATIHSKFEMKPLHNLSNLGIGKAILCVANGYSLEENMQTIKENAHNVDIICCDKTLGHLIDNGVKPTYVMVCDANVNYEKYMEKWKDQLSDSILLINVCGNPKWSKNGNWKDVYFFVNKDVIDSHLEFSGLSGCQNFIPAGTNVSNAMIIILSQSDNDGKKNFFGYDKMLLIGYDYSWRLDGKYYAYDENGDGKADYMRHIYFNSPSGKFCYSSGNLSFSKDWITKYINTFNLPVVQCAKDTLLNLRLSGDLGYQMSYRHKTGDAFEVRSLVKDYDKLQKKLKETKNKLDAIGKDHHMAVARSI